MMDLDLGHVCRGRGIPMSGHSDLGSLNNAGGVLHFDVETLRPPLATLTNPALYIPREGQNRLSQCHLEAQQPLYDRNF